MRLRGIVFSAIVFVVALLVISNSAVLACGPVEFDAPSSDIWCEVRSRPPVPTPTPTPVQVVAAAKPAVAITQKSGDSPANALEVGPDLQTISAGGRRWYKIGNDGMHMDVWVETYGNPGLGFAVYAPNQDINAVDTKPKGVGTYPNNDPSTLRWAGGSFLQRGTWYALVSNSSSNAVTYRIGATQSPVDKACTSPYWEILPTGQGTYWVLCK
jgi:hypothetical protein